MTEHDAAAESFEIHGDSTSQKDAEFGYLQDGPRDEFDRFSTGTSGTMTSPPVGFTEPDQRYPVMQLDHCAKNSQSEEPRKAIHNARAEAYLLEVHEELRKSN